MNTLYTNTLKHEKARRRFNSGNIFLLIINLFFLSVFVSSLMLDALGYYFLADNRERFLKLLIFIVAALSFGVISPDKKKNKVSLFTYILLLILPVNACMFIYRIIFRYIKYESVYTFILCVIVVFLVFFAIFERFKEYGNGIGGLFMSKVGKYLKKIPFVLACLTVVFFVFILIRAGLKAEYITAPPSYSTQVSPNDRYVAKLEEESDSDNPYRVNIYRKRKPVKVFIGKLVYTGFPIVSYPQKSRYDTDIRWIDNEIIEIKGSTYNIHD